MVFIDSGTYKESKIFSGPLSRICNYALMDLVLKYHALEHLFQMYNLNLFRQ